MPTSFRLTETQRAAASQSAARARTFMIESDYPLGRSMIDYAWHCGSAQDVVTELGRYQMTMADLDVGWKSIPGRRPATRSRRGWR